MSRLNYPKIATALAVASLAVAAVGCGQAGSSVPVSNLNQGLNNGAASGTCISISQQIPFTATNIYYDWANIVAGATPMSGQSVGTVRVGGAPTGGQYFRQAVDGIISMNITQGGMTNGTPYPNYPNGTTPVPNGYPNYQTGYNAATATATGFIQLSPMTQQDILYYAMSGRVSLPGVQFTYPGYAQGNMPGYVANPGMYPTQNWYNQNGYYPQNGANSQVCVSGIAFNLGHYYNMIYGGRVYLYLNNTQQGYWFPI